MVPIAKNIKTVIIIALLLQAALLVGQVLVQGQTVTSQNTSPVKIEMVKIPGGTHKRFLKEDSLRTVKVKAFMLGKFAITNAQFLQFVKHNPEWAKSTAKRIYCDENYLKHWKKDLEPGSECMPNAPVTDVSWFAAQAFAKWAGYRLPALNEWEYAAAAKCEDKNISLDNLILQWYSKPGNAMIPAVGSVYKNKLGVYDMFGLIWEWVSNFNSVIMQSDSRTGQQEERNLFCGTGSQNPEDAKNYAAYMRYAFRNSLKGNYTVSNLGFRVAADCK
jgi:formylglycine-generating enzyme required for sulfatase activity